MEIVANILKILKDKNELDLKEIGTLIHSEFPAAISPEGHLKPSIDKFEFIQKRSIDDSQFLEFFRDSENIEQLQKAYNDLCSNLRLQLFLHKRANVKGFGEFLKINGKIEFFPENQLLKNNSYEFGEIELAKNSLNILAPQILTEEKQDSSLIPANQKDQKRNYLNPLLDSMGAILVFLILFTLFHNGNFPIDDWRAFAKLEKIEIDQVRLNKSPEVLLINESSLPDDSITESAFKYEKNIECALILGSFTNDQNAAEMQKRVISLGYNLYTEVHQDFIRVGIRSECSKINGALFEDVKNNTGIDPWLRVK